MRFMAMASVVCASREIEPKDMAPVEKRLTISTAGSTSSSDTGVRPNSSARLDLEQAADGVHPQRRFVHQLGEFAVAILGVAAHGMLQGGDHIRRPGMAFAAHAVGIFAADIERRGKDRILAEGCIVAGDGFLGDMLRGRCLRSIVAVPKKYLSTRSDVQADGVEDLRAAIGLVGRDAHLGHDLEDALADRLDVAARRPRRRRLPSGTRRAYACRAACRRRDRG